MSFYNYSSNNLLDYSIKSNKYFKHNSKSDIFNKNKNFYPQKKISSLLEIEVLSNNLSKIIDLYFTSHNLLKEQQIFNEKYKNFNNNHNVLILLLMHDFPNFNIYDYLHLKIDNNPGINKNLIREQKLMIIVRNNIILTLLIVANQLHEFEIQGEISFDMNSNEENDEEQLIFYDLSFLNKLIKDFKKKLIQYDNIYNIEYDVEILFLSLLGLSDIAKTIKQKHNDYFSNLLYECNLNDINFDTFIDETIEKSIYGCLEINELILYRRILNNAARRNFYFGFVFLLHHVEFCYIISEGRIWKNIGKKMSFENIFNLWELYNDKINDINEIPQKETLSIEYAKKIEEINQRKRLYQYTYKIRNNMTDMFFKSNSDSILNKNSKINKSYFINENLLFKKDKMYQNFQNMMEKADYDIQKLNDEIELSFVKNIEDLLIIFFKTDLKDLVMDFLDRTYLKNKNYLFPTRIFEICLNYDEDISIDILNKSIIDNNNTKFYMQNCIIKKYFRLARRLLKYKQSKEYLNTPPPKSESYINWLSKIQIFTKKKVINNILHKHPKTITLINLIKAVENQDNLINEFGYDIYQFNKKSFFDFENKSENYNIENNMSNSSINNDSFISNNNSYKNYFINSQSNIKTSIKTISTYKNNKKNKLFKNFFNKEKENYSYRKINNNTTNSENLLLNEFNNVNLIELNKRKSFDKSNIKSSSIFRKIQKMKISTFFDKKQKSKTKIEKNPNSSQKFPKNFLLNLENKILNVIIKRKKSNNNNNEQIPIIKVISPKLKTEMHSINITKDLLNNSNKNYQRRTRIFVPKKDESKKINFNLSPLNINIKKQFNYGSLIKKIKSSRLKNYQKNILFPNENIHEIKKFKKNSLRENEIKTKKNSDKKVNNSPKKTKINRSKSLKITTNYKNNYTKKSTDKFEEFDIENIKKGKFCINVQIVLIEQLRNPEFVVDILCLLNEIKETKFLVKNASKIIRHLLVFIKNEDYITKCKEPLLFIALSSEFLMKIGNLEKKYFDRCKTFADEILELGVNLITSLNDEEMLNFFLKEQFDSKNRNSLEIFAENQFYKILNDNNVGNVCEKLWYGEEHQNIINYLRLTQILFSDFYYEDYYNIIKNNFDENNNKIIYSFQYEKYNNNISIRFYIDSVFIILIALFFEVIIYNYISKYYNYDSFQLSYNLSSIDNLAIYLIFTYVLNYLFLCIFIIKTDRIINFDKFESFLVLILFFILLIIKFNIPTKIFQESSILNLIYSILLSVVVLILWLKVFIILSVTNTYGPFIRILFNIFDQFFCFMIIFICITFCFAQIFSIFFKNSNEDFILFFESFLSLFNTAFGQVYFDNFTIMTVFGYSFLIFFTTFSNIILFNLIVSILNNFYNECEEIADAQSRAMLVINHEKFRWNGNYDLLIFLPVPFNILSFPFCVYLLFIKDAKKREKLNDFYCRFFFIIIAFILFVVLFIFGIIIYPFALIKSYYHSIYDVFNKDYLNFNNKNWNKNSKISQTLKSVSNNNKEIDFIKNMTKRRLILDFILRPIKLVYYFYEDLVNYWKLIYKKEKNNKKNKIYFNKEFIIELRKTFCDLHFKERKKIITMYDLYKILYLNNKTKKKLEINNTFSTNEMKNENSLIYNKNKIFYNLYKSNNKSSTIYQEDMKDIINLIQKKGTNFIENFNKHLYNTLNISYIKKNKFLNHAIKVFKILIYKLSNPEGYIDIERALAILPYRVRYNKEYLNSLYYLNLRALIKGFRKFLFMNEKNNFIFSFKKLQIIVYKLMIKMELMFNYLPKEIKDNITNHFYSLNFEFSNYKIFFDKMFEKKEQESEYNDEGNDEDYFNLKVQKIISDINKKCNNNDNELTSYENSTTSVYSYLSIE